VPGRPRHQPGNDGLSELGPFLLPPSPLIVGTSAVSTHAPTSPAKKITFGEMRASGVRGLLVYCSDYKCNHSTAPFVNCFTYAERGLIYQAPVCNGHWMSQNGCNFEFSFPRNRTQSRPRNGPNHHHLLRNRITPFVTLPNPVLKLSDRKVHQREPASFQASISSADLDRSDPPAVAGMHAATDNVATAVIIVVVIVCVRIVVVIVAVGSEAEPYKRTSVKSSAKPSTVKAMARETSMKAAAAEASTTKSTAMEASSAKAASVTTATSATTSECRSWLSQADRCQCEQGYNRIPHHAYSLGTTSQPEDRTRSQRDYSAIRQRSQ
jgi:hypothetical protein